MSAEFLSLAIHKAEDLRAQGDYRGALAVAEPCFIDPNRIPDISPTELSDYIRMWRIAVVSELSLAQRQWLAKDAKDILSQAKSAISTYYLDPEVRGRAGSMIKDREGNDYDHVNEMMRDIGKYHLIRHAVSGQSSSIHQAVDSFRQAMASSKVIDCRSTATIEYVEARYKQTNPKVAPVERGLDFRALVIPEVDLVIASYPSTSNPERLRWVLLHAQDLADENTSEVNEALADKIHWGNEANRLLGSGLARRTRRQHDLKRARLAIHKLVWENTRRGVDFTGLDLPGRPD